MVDEVVVVVVMLVVESGWLSSIDNKVTFPWEAAWRSRESPLSRAAGPLPLRGGTTEGHQPAGGRRSSSSKGYTLRWKTSSERMHWKASFSRWRKRHRTNLYSTRAVGTVLVLHTSRA